MDNIHAALLLGQIKRIDNLWERRDEIWRTYEEAFAALKGLRLLRTVEHSRHARHLFTILVKSGERDSILHKLQEKRIGVAVNYRPIHLLKYYRMAFKYREGDFPIAEEIGKRTLSLPLYPALEEKELSYVTKSLKLLLRQV